MSVLEEMYTGASDVGKFMSTIVLYGTIIIAFIMTISAMYLFTQKQYNLVDINGSIKEIKSTTILVEYDIAETKYVKEIERIDKDKKDDIIELTYDSKNPEIISRRVIRNNVLGLALISFGIIAVFISWFFYYMNHRFKLWAAAQGTGTVLNMILIPFR